MNNSIFKFTKEEKINIQLKTKIVQTNNEINYKIDEKIIDRFKLLSCALLVDNEKLVYSIINKFRGYFDMDDLVYYDIPLWVAQYNGENYIMDNYPRNRVVLWQFTTNNNTQDENHYYGFGGD